MIDRASMQDEQANFGAALAERLAAGDLSVEVYYFQEDARICRRAGAAARGVSLGELAARHPDHRLLIFSDGAGFFDPFSGEPQPWLEEFASWPERAMLTPVPVAHWGYREVTLAAGELVTLPADDEGLTALTNWLNTGQLAESKNKTQPPALPALIARRPKRWLERVPPQPQVMAELVGELKRYLGADAWRWFAACAVYPQLAWELTLYLGAQLNGLGQTLSDEAAQTVRTHWQAQLQRLLRLPWFRYGTLPDWLRNELLASLSLAEDARLRAIVTELLARLATQPDETLTLEVATDAPPPQNRWQRIVARWRQWRRRGLVWPWLEKQPETSPLRDYVFLNFLAGRRPQRLAVQAPRLWERWLFVGGWRKFGGRPLMLGATAVLMAGLLWWQFYVKPQDTVTPQPFTAAEQEKWPVVKTDEGHRVQMPNGVTLDLISVAGGEFMMGWDKSQWEDERPAHRVQLTAFNLGKYEVTQEQWLAVMDGQNPSNFKGTQLPVEGVSWEEAQEFCRRLTAKTNVPFSLPTEAQWEYAARAGHQGEYGFDGGADQLGLYAWHGENSGNKTHPVGQKRPNRWGLYDMHGNVWEWCQDVWHDNYSGAPADGSAWLNGGNVSHRVLRGGSWFGSFDLAHAVGPNSLAPDSHNYNFGFRVVVFRPTPFVPLHGLVAWATSEPSPFHQGGAASSNAGQYALPAAAKS